MEKIARNKVVAARAGLLALLLLTAIPGVHAQRAAPRNVIEHVTRALEKDDGFSRVERREMIDAIRAQFADYSLQIVPGEMPDSIRVVMRMIIEGQFDGASKDRIAQVAFAAYQAISRGAPADVAEGIALYGYRKKIPAERISVWANGYHQLVEQKVPGPVASDLVRNAMEHDWEDGTFNTFKWALVRGRRDGFNMEDYAAYLFGKMLAGGETPGRLTADARAYFLRMKKQGRAPVLPEYEGSFSREKAPEIMYEALPEKPNEVEEKPEKAPGKPEAPPETIAPSKPAPEPAEPPRPNEPAPVRKPEKKPEPRTPDEVKNEPKKGITAQPRPKGRILDLDITRVWPGLDKSSKSYIGTPYVWGGTTRKGIDCSALTKNTYGENKIGIPRVSRQQWTTGKPVKLKNLREGDLVFFNTMGVGVSHVGMVVAGKPTQFIHASSSRGVIVDKLSKSWFKKRYLGGRRIVP